MELIEFIILIPVWIIFSLVVSSTAKRKGRDAIGYFFLSLFLSPLFAMLVLLISGDSDKKRIAKLKEDELIKKRMSVNEPSVETNFSNNKLENLERLGNLLEKGVITKDEFEIEKKKILLEDCVIGTSQKKGKVNEEYLNLSLEKLYNEIEKSKNSLWSGFNYEITSIIEELCDTEERTKEILLKFHNLYEEDLIEKLKGISSQFDSIKKYLAVFIEFGFIEKEFPHKRLIE
jgi:hypothetical protein